MIGENHSVVADALDRFVLFFSDGCGLHEFNGATLHASALHGILAPTW